MTLPFNIASRCPVLSVPSGRSRDGVPTGLSVVGKTYDDVTAFRVAAAHEERFAWLDDPGAVRRCKPETGRARLPVGDAAAEGAPPDSCDWALATRLPGMSGVCWTAPKNEAVGAEIGLDDAASAEGALDAEDLAQLAAGDHERGHDQRV